MVKRVEPKRKKVPIGKMKHKIQIFNKDISSPFGNSIDFGQDLTPVASPYVMIRTITPKEIFDGVNLVGTATHEFHTRYNANITSEMWIMYDNKFYDIISIQDDDGYKEFMILNVNERGSSSIVVNEIGDE
jgi:SPP1 family predicted phage head-tail adaptor